MAVLSKTAAKNPGKVFLSVEDIADRFTDYQVFDVRFNLMQADHGRNEYEKAHIPRAVFVDMDMDLSGDICASNGRHPLPSAASFISFCKSKSIGGDKPILCYDDECGGMGGCRMWWMLHALGVEAYVLNGGFQAYRAANLPIETGPLNDKPLEANVWPFRQNFAKSLAVDEIPCNAVLVDARAADRFDSTVRPYGCDVLPGHIENALNMPWTVNVVAGGNGGKVLRPEDECRSNVLKTLRGAWKENGTPDVSNCVFYCGSGVTATFNIALVCHLGLGDPFLYCGAWSQYQTLYAVSIARHTVNQYGLLFKMISSILAGNQKATHENAIITVDGAALTSSSPDKEIQEAVQHMHLWEKAQVFFKSGRIAVIEVAPRR